MTTPLPPLTVDTTITWTSHDVVMHTVTAKDFFFGSRALRPQASFRHVFKEAGNERNNCRARVR